MIKSRFIVKIAHPVGIGPDGIDALMQVKRIKADISPGNTISHGHSKPLDNFSAVIQQINIHPSAQGGIR
jgi:hypothetical protein